MQTTMKRAVIILGVIIVILLGAVLLYPASKDNGKTGQEEINQPGAEEKQTDGAMSPDFADNLDEALQELDAVE